MIDLEKLEKAAEIFEKQGNSAAAVITLQCVAELSRLRVPKVERPTVEGWYWYQWNGNCKYKAIEVFRDVNGHWWASSVRRDDSYWHDLENMRDGDWYGPIPQPESEGE